MPVGIIPTPTVVLGWKAPGSSMICGLSGRIWTTLFSVPVFGWSCGCGLLALCWKFGWLVMKFGLKASLGISFGKGPIGGGV